VHTEPHRTALKLESGLPVFTTNSCDSQQLLENTRKRVAFHIFVVGECGTNSTRTGESRWALPSVFSYFCINSPRYRVSFLYSV